MKIIIRTVEQPSSGNSPQELIHWFCEAFGFSSGEDENSIEEQILKKFVEAAYSGRGLSSSELKFTPPVARSTVIYHLNRFIDSGLLVKRGRLYYLRAAEMSKAIQEIEYDIDREMRRMLDLAKEFDSLMERSFQMDFRQGNVIDTVGRLSRQQNADAGQQKARKRKG